MKKIDLRKSSALQLNYILILSAMALFQFIRVIISQLTIFSLNPKLMAHCVRKYFN